MPKRVSREVRAARYESLDAAATSALDWYQKEVAELDALGLPSGEYEQRKTALFMEFGRRGKKAMGRANRITEATLFEQRARDRPAPW